MSLPRYSQNPIELELLCTWQSVGANIDIFCLLFHILAGALWTFGISQFELVYAEWRAWKIKVTANLKSQKGIRIWWISRLVEYFRSTARDIPSSLYLHSVDKAIKSESIFGVKLNYLWCWQIHHSIRKLALDVARLRSCLGADNYGLNKLSLMKINKICLS